MATEQRNLADQMPRWYSCQWRQDNDGIWETSCGNAFEFNSDGPKENGMRFCPYCGKLLRAVAIVHGDT